MDMGNSMRIHEEPRAADCKFCMDAAESACEICQRPICPDHSAKCGCENAVAYCKRCAERGETPLVPVGAAWVCAECLDGTPVICVTLGAVDVVELMPPMVPIYEESPIEVIA